MWDYPSGELRRVFTTGESEAHHERVFSPDGRWLALKEANGRVSICDVERGCRQAVVNERGVETALAFAPDGRILATGDQQGLVHFWDTSTGRPARAPLACRTGAVSALAWSPVGRTLIVAPAGEAAVRLWHVPTGRDLFTLPAPVENLRALVVTPDNRALVGANLGTADAPSRVVLWECGPPEP